jgi:hypothetical protein
LEKMGKSDERKAKRGSNGSSAIAASTCIMVSGTTRNEMQDWSCQGRKEQQSLLNAHGIIHRAAAAAARVLVYYGFPRRTRAPLQY